MKKKVHIVLMGLILLVVLMPGKATSAYAAIGAGNIAVAESVDFGDAPEGATTASYPTTLANNGARHLIDPKVYLGQWVEADSDGQPNIEAVGDDILDGTDDEDGVAIPSLMSGTSARIGVTASVEGYINAWFDFNGDGDWNDTGEYLLQDVAIPAGISTHLVKTPIEGPPETYARFRFTSRPIRDMLKEPPFYVGLAADGEVEDYKVTIQRFGPDSFEPNDVFSQAVDLGRLNQNRNGLGIHEAGEKDWFKWTALNDGEFSLEANSNDLSTGLIFNLYDSEGRRLASSEGKPITWRGSKGMTYYMEVLSQGGLVVTDYQLLINAYLTQNYAVLFAGGIDQTSNYPRYYDNIKKMYETLISYFPISADHIWILYADGTDPAVDRSDGLNSDMSYASAAHVMAAIPTNLQTVLTATLPTLVDENDHFLFYSFDHGGGAEKVTSSQGEEVLWGYGNNNYISDNDLNSWLSMVGAGHTTIVHTQCFAGGMIDDLLPTASNLSAASATNHYEGSWGNSFANAYADALINGYVTSYDAYVYAHDHDPSAIARGTYPDNGGTWTDHREHPWIASTTNFQILPDNDNRPPILLYRKEWKYQPPESPWESMKITYDMLRSSSKFLDPDMDSVGFRIESVEAGRLFKNGKSVVPGETTVFYGESLQWFPAMTINSSIRVAADLPVNAFTVRLTDMATVSDDKAVISINMGSPSLPDAIDDQTEMAEDSANVMIDVLRNDLAEGPLVITGVGQPVHGAAVIVHGQVLYTPAPNFYGEDGFTYTIADASQSTDFAFVTVKILDINDPPEAYDDTLNVMINSHNNLINPLLNDDDIDSSPLMVIAGSNPTHGTLVALDDSTLSYTPTPGYAGTDIFTYFASDGKAQTQANVRVTVASTSQLDWGDAPEFDASMGGGYPTRGISDGARHVVGGPWLGRTPPDVEADGQPNASAAGDDTHEAADEDGVKFPVLVIGKNAQVEVEINGGGYLDAWIDWNANHMWEDPEEKIYSGFLATGLHTITVPVPSRAVPGTTFARVRLSSQGGLTPCGLARDGEVEDYALLINTFTPGDANGDGIVNMGDAVRVMRIILGLDPATPGADANADGTINMADVTKIQRIILGI